MVSYCFSHAAHRTTIYQIRLSVFFSPRSANPPHGEVRMKSIAVFLSAGLACAAGSLFLCRTASAQQITPTYFSLENFNSRLCLSLPGPANQLYPGDGLQLTQEPCDGRQGEIWYQGDRTSNGETGLLTYTLASDYYCCSLMVAGVQADVMQDGTSVITWSEDPTMSQFPLQPNNQGWGFYANPDFPDYGNPSAPPCFAVANAGRVPFGNSIPGLFVMGVLGGSLQPGAPIVIWSTLDEPGGPYYLNSDQYWCAISPGPPSPYL